MAEAENDGPKPALNDIEPVPSMTFWEKVGFLWFPTYLTLVAAPFFLIAAFLLAGFTVVFVLHPHLFKQEQGAHSLLWLAAGCAVFGAMLVYPARFFRKMRKRKRETGSLFPSGEELAALWFRKEHPPVWMRILVPLLFSLPAFGITYEMMVTPGHRALAAWGITGLFWLIAIAVAVDAFWPRKERLWTWFVASGALGALAIMFAVVDRRQGYHGALAWIAPILFASLSVLAAVTTIRDAKKRMRGAAANRAPSC